MSFQCTHCSKSYATQKALTAHMTDVANEGKYKCETCNRGFKRPGHLREHAKTHRSDDDVFYKCPSCDYKTRFQWEFNKHVKFGHDENGNYIRVSEERVVLQHLHDVFQPVKNKFTCDPGDDWAYVSIDTCFYIHEGASLVLFEVDEQQHKDGTKYTVDGEIVRMRNANNIIRRECPDKLLIWVRFNPNTFKWHQQREFPELDDVIEKTVEQLNAFPVPTDDVSFIYVNYDVNSAGVPDIVKDDAFPEEWLSSTHSWSFSPRKMQVHGVGNLTHFVHHTCPHATCDGRHFTTLALLKRHVAEVHEGQKRARTMYQCPQCDHEPFTQSHNLEAHVRNVHGEKETFTCAKCTKTFPDKGRCREHEKRVHLMHGFQPLKCSCCNFTTNYTQMMKKHMASAHMAH